MPSRFFSNDELCCKCQHCGGKLGFNPIHLVKLDAIRAEFGQPMIVSSAYRCPEHPIEKAKKGVFIGEHQSGDAVDILVHSDKAYRLVEIAIKHGVMRIGIQQSGPHDSRFIHLGFSEHKSHPTIWSY